jgi:hypothetical protein
MVAWDGRSWPREENAGNLLELAKGVKALGASIRAMGEGGRGHTALDGGSGLAKGAALAGIAAQSLLAQKCFT